MAVECLFWGSLSALAYVYLFYPAVLRIFTVFVRARPAPIGREMPSVSFLICAYNESAGLGQKIKNTLEIDYPGDCLEVWVVSDASTDGTEDIARSFAPAGVRLLALPRRSGKTAAQNAVAREARGEILVFSDANTFYEPETLRRLVRRFEDPRVGCVSGELSYRLAGESLTGRGERLYWLSETRIKESENRIGVAVGVTGGVYAVRKNLYQPFPDSHQSDLITPFLLAERGYRTVYDPEARVTECPVDSGRGLFEAKRRIVLRAAATLWSERRFLNVRRFGRWAWCLWSHKVLRWLAPLPLAGLLGSSLALADRPLYSFVLGLQAVFYVCAAIGWSMEKCSIRIRGFFIPYYFCVVNAAAAMALISALRGREIRAWTPQRPPIAAAG